jgi:hypothetical protein
MNSLAVYTQDIHKTPIESIRSNGICPTILRLFYVLTRFILIILILTKIVFGVLGDGVFGDLGGIIFGDGDLGGIIFGDGDLGVFGDGDFGDFGDFGDIILGDGVVGMGMIVGVMGTILDDNGKTLS